MHFLLSFACSAAVGLGLLLFLPGTHHVLSDGCCRTSWVILSGLECSSAAEHLEVENLELSLTLQLDEIAVFSPLRWLQHHTFCIGRQQVYCCNCDQARESCTQRGHHVTLEPCWLAMSLPTA
jgi:hypothetical protein